MRRLHTSKPCPQSPHTQTRVALEASVLRAQQACHWRQDCESWAGMMMGTLMMDRSATSGVCSRCAIHQASTARGGRASTSSPAWHSGESLQSLLLPQHLPKLKDLGPSAGSAHRWQSRQRHVPQAAAAPAAPPALEGFDVTKARLCARARVCVCACVHAQGSGAVPECDLADCRCSRLETGCSSSLWRRPMCVRRAACPPA